ncbi:MAG TPA: DnaA N-terminal domain-containing protein, partial [Gemmataceae bacterium]|nr:DnaA N-terminal domain-containing protein [Gemmataceae bacterium]
MTTSQHGVAAELEQALVQRIGERRFNLWFASNARFRCDDNQLTVGVPNLFFQNYLESKFGTDVAAAATEAVGAAVAVRFVIEPALFQAARRE